MTLRRQEHAIRINGEPDLPLARREEDVLGLVLEPVNMVARLNERGVDSERAVAFDGEYGRAVCK